MKLSKIIFIVDDDPIHLQIAKIMIERQAAGIRICLFSDAKEVLDYLLNHAQDTTALPDLILLDLNMPVMDGYGFLEAYAVFLLHLLSKNIRIYVLTSSIDKRDKDRVATYNFVTGYLTKPLSQEVIAHFSSIIE